MPRKKHPHPKRMESAHHKAHHALKSADNLFTKKVVLVDSYAVAGDSLLANGINITYASSNGLTTDIATTPILPQ